MSRARQVANFDPALFAADEVSGDKVSGGTIGAGVIGASVTGGAGLSGMTSLGTVTTGTYNATIGSSATFPASMVRQVKRFGMGTGSNDANDVSLPGTAVGFDNAILASSDVWIMCQGTFVRRSSHTDFYVKFFISGGGLGSTQNGQVIHKNLGNYLDGIHARIPFGGNAYDSSPGSTTPTYSVYAAKSKESEFETDDTGNCGYITIMEVTG